MKNIAYEPTIVVHDYDANDGNCTVFICLYVFVDT